MTEKRLGTRNSFRRGSNGALNKVDPVASCRKHHARSVLVRDEGARRLLHLHAVRTKHICARKEALFQVLAGVDQVALPHKLPVPAAWLAVRAARCFNRSPSPSASRRRSASSRITQRVAVERMVLYMQGSFAGPGKPSSRNVLVTTRMPPRGVPLHCGAP